MSESGLAQRLEAVADAMEEVERGKYEEMLQTKELRSIAQALKEIAAEMREPLGSGGRMVPEWASRLSEEG